MIAVSLVQLVFGPKKLQPSARASGTNRDMGSNNTFDSAQKGQFDQSCQPRINKPLNFGELPQRIVVLKLLFGKAVW